MELKIYSSLEILSQAAAKWIAELSRQAIAERGRFTIALSGGETPKVLYETLAQDYSTSIDWRHIHFFWGDERCVPNDNPASNYRMVNETLLDKIPIPQSNVHRVLTELSPEDAAFQYSAELRKCFEEDVPAFDLILLGLGGDGHTASLFPGMSIEEMSNGMVVVTHSPLPPPIRISLTLPVINNARNVAFLVSGSGKREILKAVLEDRKNPSSKYPSAHVQPEGELVWFIDKAGAPKISLPNDTN